MEGGKRKMDVKDILKHVDHTLLLQPSTWAEILNNSSHLAHFLERDFSHSNRILL